MTMHGTIMVFMVLTTAPQSGFGNYFLRFKSARPKWVSRTEHAFVLDDVRFADRHVDLRFRSGWRADRRLDRYPPLSATGQNRGPVKEQGDALDRGLDDFLRRVSMGALDFITTTD